MFSWLRRLRKPLTLVVLVALSIVLGALLAQACYEVKAEPGLFCVACEGPERKYLDRVRGERVT